MSTLNKLRHDKKLSASTVTTTPRPTLSLPPLRKLNGDSIESGLRDLKQIFFPPPPSPLLGVKLSSGAELKLKQNHGREAIPLSPPPKLPNMDTRFMKNRRSDRHDTAIIVPDSGYASAEEEEDEDEDVPQDLDLDQIRADSRERDFATKWVVGLIARSDVWMSKEEGDLEKEMRLLDEAVELLDAFHRVGVESGDEGKIEKGEEDVALVREFVFPLCPTQASRKPMGETRREVHVQLNDLPVSQDDHTSVGLQSWGSCIILAERICEDPERFLKTPVIPPPSEAERRHIRILELGAGTGMLSVVCAKILRDWNWEGEIVATDYHADVLRNLEGNVRMNLLGKGSVTVTISHLDWQHPSSYDTKFDEGSFDIILAADVIYDPHHASWIKAVVKRLLVKPGPLSCDDGVSSGARLGSGTFWLFIPVRTTGRHEGMVDTVRELFPSLKLGTGPSESTRIELAIVDSEEVARRNGIGRADEVGYRLYRIGWAPVWI